MDATQCDSLRRNIIILVLEMKIDNIDVFNERFDEYIMNLR